MTRFSTLFFLLAISLSLPGLADTRPEIRFVCTIPTNSPAFSAGERLYQHAFMQLGYGFRMEFRPARRAQVELEAGRHDGDCGRIAEFVESDHAMPVLRVDISLTSIEAVAVTYNSDLLQKTRDQLIGAKLRIGYIRGNLSVEREMTRTPTILPVGVLSPSQGLRMLSSGRLDVFIFPDLLTATAMAEAKQQTPPLVWGVWQTYALYPYLHARHQQLLPELTQALKSILEQADNPISPYQQ